jgi:hypothetical protein
LVYRGVSPLRDFYVDVGVGVPILFVTVDYFYMCLLRDIIGLVRQLFCPRALFFFGLILVRELALQNTVLHQVVALGV